MNADTKRTASKTTIRPNCPSPDATRKADNGVVMFGQDEAAAQAFNHKASKAGFRTVVGSTQVQATDG
jgi:hypothetical protein